MNDSVFKKVEKKTNINKSTILSLADKLKNSNFKDEKVLNDVISELSYMTGREISDEKKNKIINAIKNDKVPKIQKTTYEFSKVGARFNRNHPSNKKYPPGLRENLFLFIIWLNTLYLWSFTIFLCLSPGVVALVGGCPGPNHYTTLICSNHFVIAHLYFACIRSLCPPGILYPLVNHPALYRLVCAPGVCARGHGSNA